MQLRHVSQSSMVAPHTTPDGESAVATAQPVSDVLLFDVKRNVDERGFFAETFNKSQMTAAGVEAEFVQDNHSYSRHRGTIRGLHYQIAPHAQAKLVQVVRGAILDVAIDLRRGSPTFGRHVRAIISAERGNQIFVPVGFAHGFCTLEPHTEVLYKVDAYYAPDHERGLRWNDPALGINWPIADEDATLSDRDRQHPRLADQHDLF